MVRCRIAMPKVVSSNPGRGKIKVMGSDGISMRSVMVSDCII